MFSYATTPLRNQLPLCGDCGEYPAVQRAVLLCGGDKHVCEDGLHLLMLPVIVSLTYELNRGGALRQPALTRLVSAPGMWLQNWTTLSRTIHDRGGHPGLYTGAAGGRRGRISGKGTGGMRHQQK